MCTGSSIVWKRIKEILPEDEMARLTDEEIAWISKKEAQVAAARAQWEGGSMQPLAENGTAARITREWVYELAEHSDMLIPKSGY